MRKKNAQKENIYITLDSYAAGWPTLKDFTPQLIKQGDKIVFVIDASDELYKAKAEYNSGAKVKALKSTCSTNHKVSPLNIINVQQGATFNLIIGDVIYEKEHNSIWKKIKGCFEIIKYLISIIRAIIGLLRPL